MGAVACCLLISLVTDAVKPLVLEDLGALLMTDGAVEAVQGWHQVSTWD